MKRILAYIALAAAAVVTLASCSEEQKKKALLPNISGKAGEVIVVIGQDDWEGAVGTTLRDSLSCDFPQLPQKEPMFSLANVPHSAFNNMFQIHRNIIVVNISNSVTEPGVIYRNDVWAAPQTVIRVNAPNSETAVKLIKENSRTITGMLEEAERSRIIITARRIMPSVPFPSTSISTVGMIESIPPAGSWPPRISLEVLPIKYAPQPITRQKIVEITVPRLIAAVSFTA